MLRLQRRNHRHAGVNENNNRYTCTLAFNTRSGSLGTVVPFVTVKGAEGQTVDIYCTGDAGLLSNGIEGFTPGDGTNSINDMACGDNIISVGAFTTATVWPHPQRPNQIPQQRSERYLIILVLRHHPRRPSAPLHSSSRFGHSILNQHLQLQHSSRLARPGSRGKERR